MDEQILSFLFMVARRRYKQILLGALASVLLAVSISRTRPISFESETKVFLNTTPGASPIAALANPLGASMDRDSIIASQEPLLRSYPVFEAVNRLLKRRGEAPLVQEPSEAETAEPSSPAKIVGELIWQVQTLLFGSEYVEMRKAWRVTVFAMFKASIGFQAQPETASFVIRFSDRSPDRAIAITKALADALIEVNQTIASEHAGRVAEFLQQKVASATQDVEASSRDLAAFMKANDFSNNADAVSGRYQIFLEERKAMAEAKMDLLKAEMTLANAMQLRTSVKEQLRDSAAAAHASKIEAMLKQLAEYELLLASRSEADDASTQTIRQRVASLREALAHTAKSGDPVPGRQALESFLSEAEREVERGDLELRLAKKRLALDEASFERSSADVKRMPELESELAAKLLTHNQKVKVLELLTENYLVARTDADVTNNKLYVIEEPSISPANQTSKLKLFVLLLLGAIAVVIGALALFDFLAGTIYNAKQIPKARSIDHLGAVPHVPHFKTGNLAVKARQSESLAKVAFRLARAQGDKLGRARIVVVTGANPMAGKSFTSLAIAVGLEGRGHSVVVIDCDQRATNRNVLEFGERSAPFVAVVRDAEQVVERASRAKDGDAPIYVTSVGTADNEVVEKRQRFQQRLMAVIGMLDRHFDYVILDGPPLLFTESLVMLEKADDIILCVPEGRVRAARVKESLETIDVHRPQDARLWSLLSDSRAHQSNETGTYAGYRYRIKAAS